MWSELRDSDVTDISVSVYLGYLTTNKDEIIGCDSLCCAVSESEITMKFVL